MSFGSTSFGAASFGAGDEIASAPDTTAPVLTSAVGTTTGATTATVGATTDEGNGTLYVVVTGSATQPSIAQIKSGQDHTGAAAAYASSQAVSTTGAKTFSATGLAASTTYYAHLVHTDAAANDSNRITSASFTTDTPDTTAPTLTSGVGTVESNALIVVGATTDEANGTMYAVLTTSATPPSATQVRNGQDHTGAAAVFAANQAIGSTGAKTFNATGLTQLTAYYPYIVHRDAAGNDSAVLSIGLRTTFRDGATGQFILDNTGPVGDNPAGILYNDVEAGDEDKWFSFVITDQDLGGGTLDINPDGTFTFEGSNPAWFEYQLEVDGANVGSPVLVELYDGAQTATPANSTQGSTSGSSNAIQTNLATPANSTQGSTSASTNATQTYTATPAGSTQASASQASSATQTHQAAPANSTQGQTANASYATQNGIASPANSTQGSTSSASSAIPVGVATPADSASGSTSSASSATQTHQATPADSVSASTSSSASALQVHQAAPASSAQRSQSSTSRAINLNLTLDPDFAEYPIDDVFVAEFSE